MKCGMTFIIIAKIKLRHLPVHWFASAVTFSPKNYGQRAPVVSSKTRVFGKIFAVRAVFFKQIRHRIQAQTIHAQMKPHINHLEHCLLNLRIIEVQIRLMTVNRCQWYAWATESHVQFDVSKSLKIIRASPYNSGVSLKRQNLAIPNLSLLLAPRWNQMCLSGSVIQNEFVITRIPRLWASRSNSLKSLGAIIGIDGQVISYIVSVISLWRWIKRQ